MFGNSIGNNKNYELGSIDPTGRYRQACRNLIEAQANYRSAQDKLIKAERAMREADREYDNYFNPIQGN